MGTLSQISCRNGLCLRIFPSNRLSKHTLHVTGCCLWRFAGRIRRTIHQFVSFFRNGVWRIYPQLYRWFGGQEVHDTHVFDFDVWKQFCVRFRTRISDDTGLRVLSRFWVKISDIPLLFISVWFVTGWLQMQFLLKSI